MDAVTLAAPRVSAYTVPTVAGALHPDLSRPGLGIELKREDARRYETALQERAMCATCSSRARKQERVLRAGALLQVKGAGNMQIDHLDNKAQCQCKGCRYSVPEGERYCSDQCRKTDQDSPTREEDRKTCVCRHDECAGVQ